MWHAIQFVTSPLTLIAFIVAVSCAVYRARIQRDIRLLEAVPRERREHALTALLGTYNITDDNLTAQQKFVLMKAVMAQKADRLKLAARTAIIMFAMFGVVLVAVTLIESQGKKEEPPKPEIIPLSR
jgi:hypothetical protein